MAEIAGNSVQRVFVILPILLLVGVGAQAVFRLDHANHDVSWLILCAQRMLEGEVLYRDIIEVNPPLIILLIIVPVWLAKALTVDATHVFHAFCMLLGAVSAGLCWLAERGRIFAALPRTRALFYILLAFFFFLYPVPHFGQREHLMVMFVLPYLVLAANRRAARQVGTTLAVAIGLFAGVGLALKPFFLLLWVAVEIYLAMSARSAGRMLRPENGAIAAVLAGYAMLILLFFTAYVANVVPFVGALYGSRNREFWLVLVHGLFLGTIVSIPIVAIQYRSLTKSPIFPILLIAALASFASFLVQQKGWAYHLIPALVTSFVLAALLLSAAIEQRNGEPAHGGRRTVLGLLLVAVLAYPVVQTTGLVHAYPFSFFAPLTPSHRATLSRLDALVEAHAPRQPIFALSAAVWPAYSLLSHGRARWPYRYPSLWPVPAFYPDPYPLPGGEKYHSIENMTRPEREFLSAVVSDLVATPPALVVVDAGAPKLTWRGGDPTRSNEFDYVDYLHVDPRFERLWEHYIKIDTVGRFDVYQRRCDNAACE